MAGKTRNLAAFTLASVVLTGYTWTVLRDAALMYFLVLFLPAVILSGLDLQEHRRLLPPSA